MTISKHGRAFLIARLYFCYFSGTPKGEARPWSTIKHNRASGNTTLLCLNFRKLNWVELFSLVDNIEEADSSCPSSKRPRSEETTPDTNFAPVLYTQVHWERFARLYRWWFTESSEIDWIVLRDVMGLSRKPSSWLGQKLKANCSSSPTTLMSS